MQRLATQRPRPRIIGAGVQPADDVDPVSLCEGSVPKIVGQQSEDDGIKDEPQSGLVQPSAPLVAEFSSCPKSPGKCWASINARLNVMSLPANAWLCALVLGTVQHKCDPSSGLVNRLGRDHIWPMGLIWRVVGQYG